MSRSKLPPAERLSKRDAAALTEKMTVLADTPPVAGAPSMFEVVTESGGSYTIDVREHRCSCSDSFYRNPSGGCKHVRRTLYALGRREIPSGSTSPRWIHSSALHSKPKGSLMTRKDSRSFSDPETHFELIKSETPVSEDGYRLGEPTGDVKCECCGASAGAPEYINHDRVDGEECPQADVTSEWYDSTH